MGIIVFLIILVVIFGQVVNANHGKKNLEELKQRTTQRENAADLQQQEQRQLEEARRRAEARQEANQKQTEEIAAREAQRSAARKEELLKKYKAEQRTIEEIQEDMRQGRILSRSDDHTDEDFSVDELELEGDFVAQIEDLMVFGPHYALSKDRDFLAEADELLWDYKVS